MITVVFPLSNPPGTSLCSIAYTPSASLVTCGFDWNSNEGTKARRRKTYSYRRIWGGFSNDTAYLNSRPFCSKNTILRGLNDRYVPSSRNIIGIRFPIFDHVYGQFHKFIVVEF